MKIPNPNVTFQSPDVFPQSPESSLHLEILYSDVLTVLVLNLELTLVESSMTNYCWAFG